MFKWINKLFYKNKILFCDLDGTLINTKSGKTFPEDKDDWYLRKDVMHAIKLYQPDYIFIVTNQGGIEKGFVNKNEFLEKLDTICREIQNTCSKSFIGAEFCVSNDKSNSMRKPNPGMVEKIIKEHKFNKKDCLMIGDASGKEGLFSDSDKKCAENTKIKYLDVNDFVIKYGKFNCYYCKHLQYGACPDFDWCDLDEQHYPGSLECIGLEAIEHICKSFNYKEV